MYACAYVRTWAYSKGNAIGICGICIHINYAVYTCAREAAYLRERIMSGGGMLSESFKGRGIRGKRRRGAAGGQRSDTDHSCAYG